MLGQRASTATPGGAPRRQTPASGGVPRPHEADAEGFLSRRSRSRLDLWIPAAYFLLCCGWIGASDRLVAVYARSHEQLATWGMLKGFGFVTVTAILLHAGLRWAVARERTAQERLRLALDASRMGSWYWELATNVTASSDRCKALFGLDPDAVMTYDRFLEAVHPEDRERVDRSMEEALAAGTEYDVEMRVPLAGGGARWVAWRGRGFRDAAGKPVSLAGVARDITDRKRSEDLLREQLALRDQFSKVASSVPGAIVSFRVRPDGGGAVIFTTPAVEELFGVSAAALMEDVANWATYVHPEDARRVNDAVADAARTVSRWHIEYRYLHPKKGLRWIEGWADPTAEPDGSILWHGFVTDITERKTIEEERKRADEALRRLGAAVEQTPASIVITDETGAIEYVNPAFERTTGYSAPEVLGQTPRVLKSGTHDVEFYRRLWETIRSGRVWSGRIVNRTKNGALFTEDAVIAPVKDAAGAVRNYVAVKRDVTEEIRLQNQLFEAQKLESVARLAGGIAHDFNNLLTVILGCAAVLRDDLASGRSASMDDVDEVRTAGERARELTRQLLAFARRQVIEPVSLDLSVMVRNSEKLLRRVLNEDIVLEVALQPDLWPVRCDAGQMEQILLNLVVNARDAMVHGGKLRIETSNQEVTEAHESLYSGIHPGPYVRLAIHDSGTGMSTAVKDRLFEPFFTTKPVGKGTGLGLATVHGIVKQSGGFVRAESEPGYGTTFELLFPRASGVASASPEAVALSPRRGGETVLLVEDDPHVRSITARMLASDGYAVLVAANGLEALELLSSHRGPLDLLVTDVIMPGVDGHRLADSIKRQWPGLLVLYVSGHAHDVLGERGALEPGIDLLPKPYTPASLLARVGAALTRRPPT
jgi:PAS domain S-box-containing protein